MYLPDTFHILTKIAHQVFFTALLLVSSFNYLGAKSAAIDTDVQGELEEVATDVAIKLIQDITNETAKAISDPSVRADERVAVALSHLDLDSNEWQETPYTYRGGLALPLEVRIETATGSQASDTSSDNFDERLVLIVRSKPKTSQDVGSIEPFEIKSSFRLSAKS